MNEFLTLINQIHTWLHGHECPSGIIDHEYLKQFGITAVTGLRKTAEKQPEKCMTNDLDRYHVQYDLLGCNSDTLEDFVCRKDDLYFSIFTNYGQWFVGNFVLYNRGPIWTTYNNETKQWEIEKVYPGSFECNINEDGNITFISDFGFSNESILPERKELIIDMIGKLARCPEPIHDSNGEEGRLTNLLVLIRPNGKMSIKLGYKRDKKNQHEGEDGYWSASYCADLEQNGSYTHVYQAQDGGREYYPSNKSIDISNKKFQVYTILKSHYPRIGEFAKVYEFWVENPKRNFACPSCGSNDLEYDFRSDIWHCKKCNKWADTDGSPL